MCEADETVRSTGCKCVIDSDNNNDAMIGDHCATGGVVTVACSKNLINITEVECNCGKVELVKMAYGYACIGGVVKNNFCTELDTTISADSIPCLCVINGTLSEKTEGTCNAVNNPILTCETGIVPVS